MNRISSAESGRRDKTNRLSWRTSTCHIDTTHNVIWWLLTKIADIQVCWEWHCQPYCSSTVHLTVLALSTWVCGHCLTECAGSVHMSVVALSTWVWWHCPHECGGTVHLSVLALSTWVCWHWLTECAGTVYLSVLHCLLECARTTYVTMFALSTRVY
jgi:ribosomal protein L37AE/L43A